MGPTVSDGLVVQAHWDDRDLAFLQEVGKALIDLNPDRVALLTAGSGNEGAFLLVASETSDLDLSSAGPEICSVLGGRGGGRTPFFQGKASAVNRRQKAVDRLRSSLGD